MTGGTLRTPASDDRWSLAHAVSPDAAIKRALVSGALTKILTVGLTIVTLGLAARSLGSTDFGIVSMFAAAATFFSFLDLGLGSAAINPLSGALARGESATVRRTLSTLLASLLLASFTLATTMSAASFIVAGSIASRLGTTHQTSIELCLTLTLATSVGTFAAAGPKVCIALQRSDWSAGALFAAAVLSAGLAGVGLISSAPPAWFLGSLLVPPVAANLGLVALALHRLPLDSRPRADAVKRFVLCELLKRGPAYMILVLASAVSFQAGPLIVGALLTPQDAGVFAITARLFSVVTSIYAIGLQQVWGSLAGHFASDERGKAREIATKWARIVIISGSALSLIVCAVARPFVRLWAGSELVPPYGLLVVFAIWSVYVIGMTYIGSVLNAAGRVGAQAAANALVATTSIPFGILLTDRLGSSGVIIATMLTHAVFVAPVAVLATKRIFAVDKSSDDRRLA